MSGEWLDPAQSIHAFRVRGALSTVTAQKRQRTTKRLRHTLPGGGEWSVGRGRVAGCFLCDDFKNVLTAKSNVVVTCCRAYLAFFLFLCNKIAL